MLPFPSIIQEELYMPQHKSAKKRVKTSAKSQARNRALRSTLRGSLKDLTAKPAGEETEARKKLQSVLDRAVNKGILHKNKAARLKSRFRPGS